MAHHQLTWNNSLLKPCSAKAMEFGDSFQTCVVDRTLSAKFSPDGSLVPLGAEMTLGWSSLFFPAMSASSWLAAFSLFFLISWTYRFGRETQKLSSDTIFCKTHCQLAVCMWFLGKTLQFLRCIFCAPSAAPVGPCFLISFSFSWKKGLLWEWCPTTEATVSSEDFEKCLLSNFTIAGKWRSLDSAIWKEYACVFKKEYPKWKKYVHVGKQYVNAKLLSSVTDYRKYLMFGVG